MRSAKALFLFAVVFFGNRWLAAQLAGVDARSIVLRATGALGCGVVTRDTTITVKGSLKASLVPDTMPLTIHSQGFTRWRSELDTAKERKVTIVNEGIGQIQRADGRLTPLARHNTSHQHATHIPCLSTLHSQATEIDVTYLRSESLTGEIVDVIEVLPVNRPAEKNLAERTRVTYWISRTTGYVVRAQFVNAAEQDFNAVEIVDVDYSDYRVVDGLAVPFKQRTSSDGKTLFELTLDHVELNAPAADFTLRGR